MRFLAGLKTHSRRPVYTPPGSAQHTIPKVPLTGRAPVRSPGTSFFGSRKSADLLPRAPRPGPRARTACVTLASLPLARGPSRTAWSTPVRGDRCAEPWSSSLCGPGRARPARARSADWPHWTWSRSMCGTGHIAAGRARPRYTHAHQARASQASRSGRRARVRQAVRARGPGRGALGSKSADLRLQKKLREKLVFYLF